MFRVVVIVDSVEHRHRHSQKPCRLPLIDASLRQPSRGGMAQRMRTDLARQRNKTNRRLERGFDGLHWLPVPLDQIFACDAVRLPSPKVRQ
jgi:hypothetical protein